MYRPIAAVGVTYLGPENSGSGYGGLMNGFFGAYSTEAGLADLGGGEGYAPIERGHQGHYLGVSLAPHFDGLRFGSCPPGLLPHGRVDGRCYFPPPLLRNPSEARGPLEEEG
jgi:hypothetical protein